ncbi:response regulator [Pseudomonas turukhanskensis]|uniref:histidine kinase n=1 Tax=Pseudomonas turukhanskensis TaxID=1806536 RepID=A0A9W6NGP5_9PSED|nr:response regulator [Pseudomonas turukhanskensis]GLK90283.1 histidine kinase [Pseudomonas turukhanskensis]
MIERAPGLTDEQYIQALTEKLREADETLEAIRTGAVDALFIETGEGVSVYTLESADRPYRTLIEQMQEGAVTLSLDGFVLYGNERLGEIVHRPLERVVARDFSEFIATAERERFRQFLADSAEEAVRAEFDLRSEDDQLFPAYLSFRALALDSSEEPIICGVVTDLTEQRLLEARLSQAQKMEAVGQLTGGLAHDFNNLLQGIKGSLDLIARRPNSEKVVKWTEAGLKAADRGAKLTAQLLAFSRSQKLELQPLRVNTVIRDMTDLLVRTIGTTVRIKLNLEPSDQLVLSDPTQLELAILNLALNARDAMPTGGTLNITTQHHPQPAEGAPHGLMQVCIADTGVGMSEEVRLKAFNAFFSTKGIGAGTGLGLAQVQSIVEQSNGWVQLVSAPGAGTQVFLSIPYTQEGEHAEHLAIAVPPALQQNGKRVMLIDDDHDVRRVVSDMLEVLGHQVREAESGLAGLKLIDVQLPDIVLLDFAMPHLNGAEVAKLLKEKHPDLPLIFISGFSDSAQLQAAVGSGATVLRKPFTIDRLSEMLEQFG